MVRIIILVLQTSDIPYRVLVPPLHVCIMIQVIAIHILKTQFLKVTLILPFLHIFRLNFLYVFRFFAIAVIFTSAFIPLNFEKLVILTEVPTNKDPERLRPTSS
jgi:hypothetical protein